MKELDRLTIDPAVMGGKPCIRGRRVTVGTIVGLMAEREKRSTRSWQPIPTLSGKISCRRVHTQPGDQREKTCPW